MKISELAERSGVPLSSIKFYLREGLLPPGERSAPNQARYGSPHLARLGLIRALRDVGGLGLEAVRAVLEELDRGWREKGDPVGEALRAALAVPPAGEAGSEQAAAEREVLEFMQGLDWTCPGHERHFYAEAMAASLVQVRRYLFAEYPTEALGAYARIAWHLSEVEYANAPEAAQAPMRGDDLTEPTRYAVLGSILFGRIFSALRNAANAMRSIRTTEGLPIPPADAR